MKLYETQLTSKPRLKNDTLGDDAIKELYAAHASMDPDQFRELAISYVQRGGGGQARKDSIIRAIQSSPSKDKMLKKAQDFILAGMGLGV